MTYSNNYSKYIEKLKLEKSRKAFQQLVESTKEVKSETISFEENYSGKTSISTESVYDSASEKSDNKLVYKNDTHSKDVKNIDRQSEIPDAKNYSAISTRVDINNVRKDENEVSRTEFDSSADFSRKVTLQNLDSEKIDKKLSRVETDGKIEEKSLGFNLGDETNKLSADINQEVSLSDKSKNNINIEETQNKKTTDNILVDYSYSDKSKNNINIDRKETEKSEGKLLRKDVDAIKDENKILDEREDPNKESKTISREDTTSYKDANSLIFSIIQEKKEKRLLTNRNSEGRKEKDEFAYLVAKPKKNEVTNLNRHYISFSYAPVDSVWEGGVSAEKLLHGVEPKVYEEMEYAINSDKYGYYPAGSYAQINSNQSNALSDLFDTISNQSNWNTPGKSIISSIRSTSDIIDALLISGPAKNIYAEDSSNEIRKNLEVSKEELEGEKNEERFISDERFTSGEFINDKEEIELSKEISEGKKDESNIGAGQTVKSGNNIIDIDKQGGNFAYISSTESDSDRWFDEYKSLGEIYVIPPYRNLVNTVDEYSQKYSEIDAGINAGARKKDVAFKIPLQNNLQFEQISRAASYNAISFFGRIGDVQQYSKTGSLDLINLTTKYFVEDKDDSGGNYTMSKLQDIEMMYRSLVLPVENSANYLNGDTVNSSYYYFTRPPLINIVLNDEGLIDGEIPTTKKITEINKPYNNLFTEIISRVDENSKMVHDTFYKNFVVTNVSIDKNDNEYNYYIKYDEDSKSGRYYDKMGFTVTLTILEIDENYLGSIPSFNNYYNTIKTRWGKN